MTPLRISNRQARWLWLSAQGLGRAPTGPLDLERMIDDLGFVQLDTIRVISRAHHHVLWSRNQNYREPMLDRHLREGRIFEHFTHDASVLPMAFLPMWRRQFVRRAARMRALWTGLPDAGARDAIKARIAQEGPLSTHAFDSDAPGKRKMWARPPHKLALDYMWYAGELATSHRENFTKFYDLSERVFPKALWETELSEAAQLDWLCHGALTRMAFGSVGEIQRFWDAMSAREVKGWLGTAQGGLVPVEIENADGSVAPGWAPGDIEARLATVMRPTGRLRILNPFDPAIRDRNRLKRLFGFDYRVEMFVPAARRQWGYYVYPLLEGDRFVGRIEAKADRKRGVLEHLRTWVEPGVTWGAAREGKLRAELGRLARLAEVRIAGQA